MKKKITLEQVRHVANLANLPLTEEDLKKLFPKNYWNKVNPALVRFGKTYTSSKEKNILLNKIKTGKK